MTEEEKDILNKINSVFEYLSKNVAARDAEHMMDVMANLSRLFRASIGGRLVRESSSDGS